MGQSGCISVYLARPASPSPSLTHTYNNPPPGDADTAASFARHLLALGGQPNLRSRWTNMRALHYAAYFDVPQLIRVVLQASQPGGR